MSTSAPPDPAKAPIFIIGTGRSGTTLLRLMLCAHPRIYVTHEAAFYMNESVFPRRKPRREFLNYYFQTSAFGWLRLNPQRVLAGLPDPLPPERIGDAFAAVMREKAADYGRVRFGDKTPIHSACLKRIFEDFPDARVVHIVRDPRGTCLSLSRMPWAPPSLFANAAYCAIEWRWVRRWKDRVLTIRLEDLIANPRDTLGRVLDYVGEPWDAAVLNHSEHIPDKHDTPPFPWLQSAAHAPGRPGVEWESMSSAEIRLIERVTRRLMNEAGYKPARFQREPTRASIWWQGLREIPHVARGLAVLFRVGRGLRDPRYFEGERGRDVLSRLNRRSWARYRGFEKLLTPPPLPGQS